MERSPRPKKPLALHPADVEMYGLDGALMIARLSGGITLHLLNNDEWSVQCGLKRRRLEAARLKLVQRGLLVYRKTLLGTFYELNPLHVEGARAAWANSFRNHNHEEK